MAPRYYTILITTGPNPKYDLTIWEKENPANPKEWEWTSADKLFLKLIKECHSRKKK